MVASAAPSPKMPRNVNTTNSAESAAPPSTPTTTVHTPLQPCPSARRPASSSPMTNPATPTLARK